MRNFTIEDKLEEAQSESKCVAERIYHLLEVKSASDSITQETGLVCTTHALNHISERLTRGGVQYIISLPQYEQEPRTKDNAVDMAFRGLSLEQARAIAAVFASVVPESK